MQFTIAIDMREKNPINTSRLSGNAFDKFQSPLVMLKKS